MEGLHYREVFDDMCETMTAIKNRLKIMHGKMFNDDRVMSLLERYEKCEEEIYRIGGIIMNRRTSS